MRFDEQTYLKEMRMLLLTAKERLKSEYADIEIYTINIWTDPQAACSAVNVDTFENSITKVEQQNAWNKKHYDRLIAEGKFEEAQSFLPSTDRLYSPADFAFSEIEVVRHQAFDENWEEQSLGKCWDVLEPVLLKVGNMARQAFSDLKLHSNAELSVNSQSDWYDHTWSMRA